MSLIEDLNWRYATKRMNGQKVPQEKIDQILEAIRLAPTSFGLQPFSVLVIENEDLRKKIQPVAYNQPQIFEASHLLVFAAWTDVTEQQIDAYMAGVAKERGIDVANLAGFKGAIAGAVERLTPEQRSNWAAKQAYIAFGIGLAAAAELKVDATPMEGFDAVGLDDVLGLKTKGLHAVTIMPLGYRDEANDQLAQAKKVRRPTEELFIEMA
ncbi:NAD(P)H-dependent oxidoreductase [Mucilaginibacter arboris]|uniref:NAD(P)H-dependent oxidoreductase n=1 Tax=Mucilaginibacter arboris TaxID=2682090 RepID=A0A7K1SXX7_9SPHI|nr:NAD(P)H-dependent oxidoreductase [Mucilaginibacter arboris]MVN22175.1 NAD(P)H-dependent oxidoreductase [Mucilaginibacter arboris]